jgi:hypothetical protein
MPPEKIVRRLPLRELLTDAEKRTRDLQEQFLTAWLARATDLRDLSRPQRRKSHFPTLAALEHAVERLVETSQEADVLADYLYQQLEEIREHARRERLNRP